ncbi:phosphomannomutase/phosphoglucomutase [Corynebacterium mendelii]|uniref:Phosphomannomutase/phosphoglucomutase n=1 Tax=Corynebacterium mendelii TaxID=2765362 RepID=A0A939E2B2_9CORY|nr:phosphomannomutase/phosphoglucomutase [Corynebacterium mendelii]MBN9644478.1 phosphomannomutase/phosphoglucomutase [Corynebacterium mendelii]
MTKRSRADVDAIVKAYDIRGLVATQLDAELARDAGASFAVLMGKEGAEKICVGHDMRDSSPALAAAFARGAATAGMDVVMLGLTGTDEMYYVSGVWDCPGAMFTASHNPASYNGIKLCRAGAKPVSRDTGLAAIADDLVAGGLAAADNPGTISRADVLADYGTYLRGLVDLEGIRPLTVAVDAGNGMAGLTVPAVFTGLPITIKPLYFELDGSFPNHEANPLDPKNLVDLQNHVKQTGADIGLAFDGDADRCFVVDNNGDPVSPSAVTAMVAKNYLAKYPGATIIHNLICSKTVPEIIADNGGTAVRTRVGHSYIKATMAEENAVFGGEHSAHYYFREFFNADSGLLAALHVISVLGHADRPMDQLAGEFDRYAASGEINSRLESAEAQKQRTDAVLEAFADRTESVDRLDGVTVQLTGTPAWFSLRPSNTEPLLRLNVEAPTKEACDALTEEILAVIRG